MLLAARLETLIVGPVAASTGFTLMRQPDPVVVSSPLFWFTMEQQKSAKPGCTTNRKKQRQVNKYAILSKLGKSLPLSKGL